MKIDLEQQDIEAIANKVTEMLRPYFTRGNRESPDIIFDLAGLCDYLKVTPKWVYQQTHLKAIPQVNLGRKQLRFRKRDIDKWLDAHSVPAITEANGRFKVAK